MNKTIKIYVFLLVLIVIGILYIEAVRPKAIDWRPTYSLKDKIPLGLYVFNQESEKVFGDDLERIYTTPYEFLDAYYDYDEEEYNIEGTIFYVNSYNDIDEGSMDEIMYFVSQGNTAFISVPHFPKTLLDSLDLELSYKKYDEFKNIQGVDSIHASLTNPIFGPQKYNITVGAIERGFSLVDSLNNTILGYQQYEQTGQKQVNFLKVPYKNGFFYLHTQPCAFTNYHLLKDENYKYAENLLSYLPKDQKIYWFTKSQLGEVINQSPMRFVASQPALRYAWYLLLITGLLFVIFNSKRKQRVVPIIKPLENTTVDFTKTIGNLYYQQKDHHDIINKKITYFLERIRNQYMLDTKVLDEHFAKKLELKSGKKQEDIQRVIDLINKFEKSSHSTEKDLIELNKAIEKIV
jgi:hypothetical protein